MPSLTTDRLILRPFVPEDAEDLRCLVVAKQEGEFGAYDHQWPTSLGAIRGIIEWLADEPGYWAVTLAEGGALIGFLSLNLLQEQPKEYNLGYFFAPEHHGHGYATEAGAAALDWAFGEGQASLVRSGTAAVNLPSVRLLERLGFRQVAHEVVSFNDEDEGEEDEPEFEGLAFALTRQAWEGRTRRP
jgi:RimJ/RimL family protein N-acetyltransferase